MSLLVIFSVRRVIRTFAFNMGCKSLALSVASPDRRKKQYVVIPSPRSSSQQLAMYAIRSNDGESIYDTVSFRNSPMGARERERERELASVRPIVESRAHVWCTADGKEYVRVGRSNKRIDSYTVV